MAGDLETTFMSALCGHPNGVNTCFSFANYQLLDGAKEGATDVVGNCMATGWNATTGAACKRKAMPELNKKPMEQPRVP